MNTAALACVVALASLGAAPAAGRPDAPILPLQEPAPIELGLVLDLPTDVHTSSAWAAFSTDGGRLAVTAAGLVLRPPGGVGQHCGAVLLLDRTTGRVLWTSAARGEAGPPIFAAADRRIVAGWQTYPVFGDPTSYRVDVRDAPTGQVLQTLLDERDAHGRLAGAPGSGTVLAHIEPSSVRPVAVEPRLQLWRARGASLVPAETLSVPANIQCFAASPKGDMVAYATCRAADARPGSRIWRSTARIVRSPGGVVWADVRTTNMLSRLAFSPDGSSLVGVGAVSVARGADRPPSREELQSAPGSEIVAWDTRRWRETARAQAPGASVKDLAFFAGGSRAVVACRQAERSWSEILDATTWGRLLRPPPVPLAYASCVAGTLDGQMIVAAGYTYAAAANRPRPYELSTVCLWDLARDRLAASLQILPLLKEGTLTIEWLAFTPDGSYDCSERLAPHVRWRANGTLLTPEATAKAHRRPEVLRQALRKVTSRPAP